MKEGKWWGAAGARKEGWLEGVGGGGGFKVPELVSVARGPGFRS